MAQTIAKLPSRIFNGQNLVYVTLGAFTVLFYTALFPPVELPFLAWFALVPWLMCVKNCPVSRHIPISYLVGLALAFITVFWLEPITVPGYIGTCLYLALYWVLAAWAIHRLINVHRWPAFIAVPIVWVACEHLRSWVITGFPWFYLGHSQATNLWVIQVADLVGAYGVTFVVAMVNGLLVDIIVQAQRRKWQVRRTIVGASITTVTVAATLGYGLFRLGEDTFYLGPKLAVVQEDYPLTVEGDSHAYDMFLDYMSGSMKAAKHNPDMIIWPETCVAWSINPEFMNASPDLKKDGEERKLLQAMQRSSEHIWGRLVRHARDANASLIVGAISEHINQPGVYPKSDKYNSAMILDRRGELTGRYDKIHLVLFGEFVPFRYTFHRLYRFLNENMTPYGRGGTEYSLTHGDIDKPNRFELKTDTGQYRYAIAICYEDTMAYLIRRFTSAGAGTKQIDFLVNISNDGWFNHSCELPQHLRICVFRAVENRIGVARAVNTGISAFIDPNGRIEQVVTDYTGRDYGPGVRGYLVQNIKLDTRVTVYSRYGDWFAITCFIISLIVAFKVDSLATYVRKRLVKNRS